MFVDGFSSNCFFLGPCVGWLEIHQLNRELHRPPPSSEKKVLLFLYFIALGGVLAPLPSFFGGLGEAKRYKIGRRRKRKKSIQWVKGGFGGVVPKGRISRKTSPSHCLCFVAFFSRQKDGGEGNSLL